MFTKKHLGAVVATTGAALALSGLCAGTANAASYDGHDPQASGCANTAITAEAH